MPQTASQDLTRRGLGLDPVVAFSLAGAIVFFLISGAFAYINLKTLRENTEAIVHSHEVIITLDELLSSTQDAETGQRGFLLTNNERYLDPYNTALDTIPVKIQEIGELTSDNPAQVRRLPVLKQHVDAKLAELKQTIDLRRTQGLDAALAIVNSDRGKVAMDAVRGQLSAMSREEAVLRAKRLEEMNSAYGTALVSSVLAGVLGIVLTIAIGVLIRRSTLARRREEWLQAGNLGLASAMMGDQRTEQLGGSILTYLANHVGAVAGAIFVGGSDAYKRSSTYGVPADAKLPDLVRPREGLLGQVAVEGKPVIVNDVPESYLEFGSTLR